MLDAAQGMTQPPPRLSERNLIAAMERHGIGTDATVADHIKKQLDRGYATKDAQVLPRMQHDKDATCMQNWLHLRPLYLT